MLFLLPQQWQYCFLFSILKLDYWYAFTPSFFMSFSYILVTFPVWSLSTSCWDRRSPLLQLTVPSTRWTVAWTPGHAGLIQNTFLHRDNAEKAANTRAVIFTSTLDQVMCLYIQNLVLWDTDCTHTLVQFIASWSAIKQPLLSMPVSQGLFSRHSPEEVLYDPLHLSAQPLSGDRELDPSWKGDWTLTRWRHDIFGLLDVNDRTAHL